MRKACWMMMGNGIKCWVWVVGWMYGWLVEWMVASFVGWQNNNKKKGKMRKIKKGKSCACEK